MRISDWSSDVCSSDLLDVAGLQFCVSRIVEIARPLSGVVIGHQRTNATPVKLLHPALAGISGSEHDTVVSDCPAVRCIAEADRRQVPANRHNGLLPGVGLVIGELGRAAGRAKVCT